MPYCSLAPSRGLLAKTRFGVHPWPPRTGVVAPARPAASGPPARLEGLRRGPGALGLGLRSACGRVELGRSLRESPRHRSRVEVIGLVVAVSGAALMGGPIYVRSSKSELWPVLTTRRTIALRDPYAAPGRHPTGGRSSARSRRHLWDFSGPRSGDEGCWAGDRRGWVAGFVCKVRITVCPSSQAGNRGENRWKVQQDAGKSLRVQRRAGSSAQGRKSLFIGCCV
jgi:hypothetical protein